MTSMWALSAVLILFLARQAHSQNTPNDPLWPLFAELLSSQTGRTVQDINTLGLSDPTINQLWTSYSANMPALTGSAPVAAPTTTAPPLPSLPLYQTSYSFSTNSNTGDGTGGTGQTSVNTATSSSVDPNAVYTQLLNMISQPSTSGSTGATSATDPNLSTVTSMQDVMNAYAQYAAPTQQTSTATAQDPMQALMQQYSSAMGSSSSLTGANSQTQTMADLLSQGGTTSTNTGTAPGYEQLLQQYNQIMGAQTQPSATTSTAGSSSTDLMNQYMAMMAAASNTGTAGATTTTTNTNTNDQLMQMLSMLSGQTATSVSAPTANTATNTATNTQTSASTDTSTSGAGQMTFEQQLKTYFPQFQSLFPTTSSGSSTNTTASASTSTSTNNTAIDTSAPNSAQMIFDALLFGPQQPPAPSGTASQTQPSTGTAPSTNTNTQPSSPLNALQNMVSSQGGSGSFIQQHMQNVLKTRASRDMGCRFLPELLELDVLPTAPIDCMNRCPFPYINSQKFGMYCMCCPPGVNDQVAGVMSLLRGAKYMESPLMVPTR